MANIEDLIAAKPFQKLEEYAHDYYLGRGRFGSVYCWKSKVDSRQFIVVKDFFKDEAVIHFSRGKIEILTARLHLPLS